MRRTEIRKYHKVNVDLNDFIERQRFLRSINLAIRVLAKIRPDLYDFCKECEIKRVTSLQVDRMLCDVEGYIRNALAGDNCDPRKYNKCVRLFQSRGFDTAVKHVIEYDRPY